MSKIRNIIYGGLIALTCASCSDFLDTPPNDLLSPDNFYKTAAQSEQGVRGVYADIGTFDSDGYLYMSECRSDNAWVNPRTDGMREYSEIGTFRATYDLETFNTVWNNLYKIIYDANLVLSKLDGASISSDAMKNQFKGEMLFMRAWSYMELARFFGNIPMITTPLSPNESKTVGQSTAREIFDKVIVPDLTEAIKLLPYKEGMVNAKNTSAASEGRADKMAATAMLARAYTTLAGFPFNDANAKGLAKTTLKSILDYSAANGDKYWAPTLDEWRKQWMPSTEYYNKYSIFAIQHRTKEGRNYVIFNYGPILPPSYSSHKAYGNQIYIEKSLEYEFERTFSNGNRDGRGVGFTTLEGYAEEPNYPTYTNDKENLTLENGSTVQVLSKTMFYKFYPSTYKLAALGMTFNESSMIDNYDWPVNFPVLRLEDMMLLYAEILAEEGDIKGALSYVNKIRQRAGCDPATASTAEEALKMVKRERRIELAGEGVRWFDMVRYGEWQSDITNMFDRYNNPDGTDKNDVKAGRYLYPIPRDQMNAMLELYKQNTDY